MAATSRSKKSIETPEGNKAAAEKVETRQAEAGVPSVPRSGDVVGAVSYNAAGEPDQSDDYTVLD